MSRGGHVPRRMCIGCRKTGEKGEMVRFRRGEDGILFVDANQKLGGRGFYLCPGDACLILAQKRIRTGRVRGIGGSVLPPDSGSDDR